MIHRKQGGCVRGIECSRGSGVLCLLCKSRARACAFAVVVALEFYSGNVNELQGECGQGKDEDETSEEGDCYGYVGD